MTLRAADSLRSLAFFHASFELVMPPPRSPAPLVTFAWRPRHRWAPPEGVRQMGRFDSRASKKMRQRRAQAAKKARLARHAEATRTERKG